VVLDVKSRAKVKTINFAILEVGADKIQPVGIIVGKTNHWALVALATG